MSHTCLTPAMWLASIWHSLIRRKRAWPGLARISQGAIRSTAANNVPNLELRLAVGERRYGRADDEAVLGVTVVERVEHGVPDALCCRLLVVGVGGVTVASDTFSSDLNAFSSIAMCAYSGLFALSQRNALRMRGTLTMCDLSCSMRSRRDGAGEHDDHVLFFDFSVARPLDVCSRARQRDASNLGRRQRGELWRWFAGALSFDNEMSGRLPRCSGPRHSLHKRWCVACAGGTTSPAALTKPSADVMRFDGRPLLFVLLLYCARTISGRCGSGDRAASLSQSVATSDVLDNEVRQSQLAYCRSEDN